MALAWYVARIRTTISWDVVACNLLRQEFQTYLPTVQATTYFAGKKTTIERPLFPSYIFILLDLEVMRWRAVNSTVGIIYMLPARAEIPSPVPTEFIDELKTRKTASAMIETTKRFLANEIVRFLSGPFAEVPEAATLRGTVLSSTEELTRLKLPVLGRETVVTVPTAQLDIAD